MIHRGTYDGTIYHNPVNRFCIISVKTADKEVPQEARSTRRYKENPQLFLINEDHLSNQQ